ncbi:MAG: trigger factor, partial [Oricola sp.]|nr:trigger factor [Oricola sp.]
LPDIPDVDLTGLKLERLVVKASDEEVNEALTNLAENAQNFEDRKKGSKATEGDRVTLDFVGKIDGEAFQGGSATDSNLVIGSKQFIPGFEDQLVGVSAGEEKTVVVTFPEDYGAPDLAGKEATFETTVKAVAAPTEMAIDDDLAKKLGIESAERLRTVVREQIESQYGQMTRQKVKRQILDALDETYSFELPERLVDAEFNNIWNQVQAELSRSGRSFEDEDTTEDEAREEYMRLAERRVRLGLVLSEIGEQAGISVSEQELQQAVMNQVRQYPGQEQQVFEFFKQNPDAVANLRAPIFEEKTVDHLLEQVSVTDKTVSKEELMADDEDEAAEAKPAKKKAAPKKAAAKKDDAEKAAPAKKAAPKKKKAEEASE